MPVQKSHWSSINAQRLNVTRSAAGHTQSEVRALLSQQFGLQFPLSQNRLSKLETAKTNRTDQRVVLALQAYIEHYDDENSDVSISVRSAAADTNTKDLTAEERQTLRKQILSQMPQQVAQSSNREGVKLWKQLAEWAELPVEALRSDLEDLFEDQ